MRSMTIGTALLTMLSLSGCDSILGVIPDQNIKPTAAFVITHTDDSVPGEWLITFDASGSSDDSRIESFIWDFGDGTAKQTFPLAEGLVRNHTYFVDSGTFVTTLVVKDDDQVLSEPFSHKFVLQENRPPFARFTISPEVGERPLIVALDASESSDPDADDENALRYKWDYGDGTRDSEFTRSPVTQHIYQTRGRHTIQLIVSDGKLNSAPAFRFLTVE